jgi:hypothetical protein
MHVKESGPKVGDVLGRSYLWRILIPEKRRPEMLSLLKQIRQRVKEQQAPTSVVKSGMQKLKGTTLFKKNNWEDPAMWHALTRP